MRSLLEAADMLERDAKVAEREGTQVTYQPEDGAPIFEVSPGFAREMAQRFRAEHRRKHR